LRGHGSFCVQHRSGRLRRAVAKILGLPAEADASPVSVVIRPDGDGECWDRRIGDSSLKSRQCSSGPLLSERFGVLELLFQLRAVEGAIHYVQEAARVGVGSLRVRLPRWLAPRVRAREEAVGNRSSVRVEIELPLVGLVLQYHGLIEFEPL
jgi:hypothetical protein